MLDNMLLTCWVLEAVALCHALQLALSIVCNGTTGILAVGALAGLRWGMLL